MKQLPKLPHPESDTNTVKGSAKPKKPICNIDKKPL
jgi:hypothetical protein